MALLEYTQEDHAETIQGRVWTGPDLKQEGEFQIAVTREALPLYNGAGWAWRMNVEIEGKATTRTETEADHPYENLTWQEAVALAKTRVMELADELGAERERAEPPPAHQHNSEKETVMNQRAVNESPAPEGPAPERGRWQTFRERVAGWFSGAEAAALKEDALGVEDFRNDAPTPGPTEAGGGSFRVLHSKADAEQAAQHLPQSHEYRIDRIIDEDGPTDSYAVTARPLPPPAEVARDAGVAQRVGQIQDPAQRAEAERLLRTIREEAAAREQPPARPQEVELER